MNTLDKMKTNKKQVWNTIKNHGNQQEQLETYLIMKTGTKPQE